MLELLRDGIWTFIGAVLALAAIAASIWIYVLQRPRKRLLVERVSRVPLITLGPERLPGLELRLNGEPMKSASVVVVRITNSGNRSITAAEFERPVTLRFEDGATVLNAEVAEPYPTSLSIGARGEGQELQIDKCLLNPGDTFLCRILVRDSRGRYKPSARVVGMKDIDTSRSVSVAKPVTMIGCVVVMIAAFILSPVPSSKTFVDVRPEEIPYLLLIFGATLTFAAVAIYDLRARLRAIRERLRAIEARDI